MKCAVCNREFTPHDLGGLVSRIFCSARCAYDREPRSKESVQREAPSAPAAADPTKGEPK